MNILVDLRALQHGNVSGVEIYVENLVRSLCEKHTTARFFLWTNSEKPLPGNFPEFSFPNAVRIHTEFSNTLLALTAAFFRAPKIDRFLQKKLVERKLLSADQKIDIVLVPDPRPTPVSKICRKITVFHDLTALHFAKSFSLKTRLWHRLVRLKTEARESTQILVPSLFTKNDLIAQFRIPEEKIVVIGAGVSEYLRPITDPLELNSLRAKYHLPEHFFLTLCTLEPRKNLRNMIEAFSRFRKKSQEENIFLVIAGQENQSIFAKNDLPEYPFVIFPGFIAEEDKSALYSAATAFIFPSLFEGFGLPVLEAMSCGAPVLCSSFSSLPEVYGDAALTFDPTQISEITEAIETISLRKDMREELSRKGIERANAPQFSWKTVAEKVVAIIQE